MSSLSSETRSPALREHHRPILGAAVLLGLFLWLFWTFFYRQFRWSVSQVDDWGHVFVIPLIAGYFVYLNRWKLQRVGFRTTWIGLLPVLLGAAWYVFTSLGPPAVRHHNLQAMGVYVALFGLLLLFAGFRAMAHLWFPFVYLAAFGQTISPKLLNYVTFKLQDIASWGSDVVLRVIGVDCERAGNLLTIYSDGAPIPLNIAEACSGMRMVVALLALGVAMAYTGLRRFWQRALLVLMAIPVALFINVLRVVTLGLLSVVNPNFAAGDVHIFIGLLWLVPALLLYLGVMWVIRRLVIEEQPTAAATSESGSARTVRGQARGSHAV